MDPITLGLIAVAAILVTGPKKAPASAPVPAPAQTPPPPPGPEAMVGVVLGGIAGAAADARDGLSNVMLDVLAQARQRAQSLPAAPIDPSYPDQSSADASVDLMHRGLMPLRGAAAIAGAGGAAIDAGMQRTATGRAIRDVGMAGAAAAGEAAGRTASDVINAGGTVADATAQAARNAADTAAQEAANADSAAAAFIRRNSPFG